MRDELDYKDFYNGENIRTFDVTIQTSEKGKEIFEEAIKKYYERITGLIKESQPPTSSESKPIKRITVKKDG